MSRTRDLSRGVAIYGAGEAAIQAVNFLLLPVYVQFLSPGDYGVLALLAGIEAPVKLFFRWGIDGAFMRYWYDSEDGRSRQRLASTLFFFLLTINGLLLGAALAFAGPLAERLLGSSRYALALQLVLLNTFAIGFTFIPFHVLRVQNRPGEYSILTVSRSLATVVLRLVLVAGFGLGVMGVVITDVIVTAGMMLALARWFAPLIRPSFSTETLRTALAFGLPRVPHGLALQVMAVADRFILERFRSLAEVGMYSMGVSFGLIPKIALGAFESAWAPFYYATAKGPDAPRIFARVTTLVVAALALLTAGISAMAADLLTLMTRGAFTAAAPVVVWTAVGVFFYGVYLLTSIGLNITARTAYYPAATMTGATVNVALNVSLVPNYGMLGAAWASAAAYAIQAVLAYRFSQRFYPITYDWQKLLLAVAAAVGGFTVARMIPEMPPLAGAICRGAAVLVVTAGGLFAAGVVGHDDVRQLRRSNGPADSGTLVTPPVETTEMAGEIVAVEIPDSVPGSGTRVRR